MRPSADNKAAATAGAVARSALALAALLFTACDDSGPVDDVFLFEGQVTYQGESIHSLVTREEGIATLQMVDLRPVLIDAVFSSSIVVGLGFGQPTADGCQASFRTNARVGSVFSIGLEAETEYCLRVFDAGSLPEDALIQYTLSVSPG